jgi:hypothetical protein
MVHRQTAKNGFVPETWNRGVKLIDTLPLAVKKSDMLGEPTP